MSRLTPCIARHPYIEEREPDIDEPSLGCLMGASDIKADVSDSEPDLGWTEASSQGEGRAGPPMDWEASAAVDLPAARERYVASRSSAMS